MIWWLAQNALTAGLLAGLVALVCRLVRPGPAVQHSLWLVVLVKLVTPPLIVWPWTLPGLGKEYLRARAAAPDCVTASEETFTLPSAAARAETNDPPASEESLPPLLAPRVPVDGTSTQHDTEGQPSGDPPPGLASVHWERLLLLVGDLWLTGTAIMCFLQLFRIARYHCLLRHTQPAPPWLEELMAGVAGTLAVRRPLTLLVPGNGSPFVWSLGRPKLLWPAALLERLPRAYARSIVTHELAHLRRRDHWVGWLQLLAECVWWWNPLFWYVRRQLRFHAELACDAWVVTTLPEDRRAYAEALIEITQLVSQTAAPLLALGIRGAARRDFERRLTMIMCDRVRCRVPILGLIAIAALALVSLPGWTQSDVQVQAVPDVKEVPAPEKPITVLDGPVEPAPENVIGTERIWKLVQTKDGQKRLWVEAKSGSGSDRDRRLDRLEEQLQELLKEVEALRGGGAKPQTTIQRTPAGKAGQPVDRQRIIIRSDKPAPAPDEQDKGKPSAKSGIPFNYYPKPQPFAERDKDGGSGMTLTRAVYKLPRAKAEALARLLAEHSQVEVLETRVEGDSLIVTTTPEAQKAIRQFISLFGSTGKNVNVQGVKFTRDGKVIVTEGREWRIIDAKSGKELETRPAKPGDQGKR